MAGSLVMGLSVLGSWPAVVSVVLGWVVDGFCGVVVVGGAGVKFLLLVLAFLAGCVVCGLC